MNPLTVVIVSQPENSLELAACLDSLYTYAGVGFELLLITERENADRMEYATTAMEDIHPRIMEIEDGYARQMMAKLFAVNLVKHDGMLVFLDDDVITRRRWNAETFTDLNGKPVIYYKPNKFYFWWVSQAWVFGENCPRQFQLALPYAQSCQSLRMVTQSLQARRAMAVSRRRGTFVSEFQIMGELALRNSQTDTIRNIDRNPAHWSINLGIFEDFEARRTQLRGRIAYGKL